jgi:predicted lipoprotein with Yx(FWY)xxD motif
MLGITCHDAPLISICKSENRATSGRVPPPMTNHMRSIKLSRSLILPTVLAVILSACSAAGSTPAAGSVAPAALASLGPTSSATAPASDTPATVATPTDDGQSSPTPASHAGGGRYGSGATPKPTIEPEHSTEPEHTPKPAASLVIREGSTSLGKVLVDAHGLTLYVLAGDSATHSTCTGGCASAWPPLTVKAGTKVSGGSGVHGKFGTFKRADGTTQVTYNGRPLYGWTGDSQPGDTTGQDVNGFSVATV